MKLFKELAAFIRRNGIKAIVAHGVEIYLGVLFRWLPGPEGIILRSLLFRCLFSKCGPSLVIYPNVYIIFSNKIKAGERLAINVNTYIDGRGGIIFGNYVIIGPNCVISSCGHGTSDKTSPMCFQPVQYGQIIIEDDVWIGANVTINPGVRIGRGSVVAAGSLVAKDLEPMGLYGGVPAKLLMMR
jgi:acetyltransferase-like isoleucine patch superfamily enzyme